MSAAITYSDGTNIENPVVQIREDHSTERIGYLRAFWCASPTATAGSPVIGYNSPGGSWRTLKAVACEVLRLYPDAQIFRNGRKVKP
jgi:hypothetical protein